MAGRGALMTVVLVAIGGGLVGVLVVTGRPDSAVQVVAGMLLAVAGYLLSLADSLDALPDRLTPDVDDEEAVASLLGSMALLAGALLVLGPTSSVLDVRTHWTLALFALLVLVLLVLHVLTGIGIDR